MTRILIIDNHPLIREGLKRLLEGHASLQVVGEAGDGYGALHRLMAGPVDLVIVDIALPGLSDVELISRLRAQRARAVFAAAQIRADDFSIRDEARSRLRDAFGHVDRAAADARHIRVVCLEHEQPVLARVTGTAELTWALVIAITRSLPWAPIVLILTTARQRQPLHRSSETICC